MHLSGRHRVFSCDDPLPRCSHCCFNTSLVAAASPTTDNHAAFPASHIPRTMRHAEHLLQPFERCPRTVLCFARGSHRPRKRKVYWFVGWQLYRIATRLSCPECCTPHDHVRAWITSAIIFTYRNKNQPNARIFRVDSSTRVLRAHMALSNTA